MELIAKQIFIAKIRDVTANYNSTHLGQEFSNAVIAEANAELTKFGLIAVSFSIQRVVKQQEKPLIDNSEDIMVMVKDLQKRVATG